jgi:hypothetical protein
VDVIGKASWTPKSDLLNAIQTIRNLPPIPSSVVEQFQTVLQSIPTFVDLASRHEQLQETFESFDPSPGEHQRYHAFVVYGWLTTTFHHAAAAFQLAEAGFGDILISNVRASFEHALYVSAFVNPNNTEEMINTLDRRQVDNLEKLLEQASSASNIPTTELSEYLVSVSTDVIDNESVEQWPRKVEQVSQRLVSGDEIYTIYRILSNRLHPGILTTLFPAATNRIKGERREVADWLDSLTYSSLSFALGACAWASWSADAFFGTSHFGPVLDIVTDGLGFIPIHNKS